MRRPFMVRSSISPRRPSRRVTVLTGAAALLSALVMTGPAASASTTKAAVPACGSGVVVSMPLVNQNTGYSSWNYGYVQLWYNYCTGYNWGRTVSLLGGQTYIDSIVYNNQQITPGWTESWSSTSAITSGSIYSPNNPAGAAGDVLANGVWYYAEADQGGVNCAYDVYNGSHSCSI